MSDQPFPTIPRRPTTQPVPCPTSHPPDTPPLSPSGPDYPTLAISPLTPLSVSPRTSADCPARAQPTAPDYPAHPTPAPSNATPPSRPGRTRLCPPSRDEPSTADKPRRPAYPLPSVATSRPIPTQIKSTTHSHPYRGRPVSDFPLLCESPPTTPSRPAPPVPR